MKVSVVPMVACCVLLLPSCDRSLDLPVKKGANQQDDSMVMASWIVGKWTAENGTSLEFKTNGTFEQIYSETQLEPGQVIHDEESAKKARYTKAKVTTVGTYRLIDEETMEVERPGVPAYRIKVKSDADDLLLIGDGNRHDRLHRND